MASKYITNTICVDLDRCREIWSNGKAADARVSLWASDDGVHVWAETNGDPVTRQDELSELLQSEGMDSAVVARVIEGNLEGFAGLMMFRFAYDVHEEGRRYASQEAMDLVRDNMPKPTLDQQQQLVAADDEVRIGASDEIEAELLATIRKDYADQPDTLALADRISISCRMQR